MSTHRLESAYRHCEQLARSHYENFPVASILLPRRLRRPVAVIYAFARTADDFADEGTWSVEERLALLDGYRQRLQQLAAGGRVEEPVFLALADVIARHRLPLELFYDLLSAFTQDVTQRRYADADALLDYCRRSANPVGRLLLHLSGDDSEENLRLSDQVCSALQLINFLQDIRQDLEENDRIYLPQEELVRFGVDEEALGLGRSDAPMQALIALQLQRITTMLDEGRALGGRLRGRFGLEIRLIIAAAQQMVRRLADHGGEVFARPRLGRRDYLIILWRALLAA